MDVDSAGRIGLPSLRKAGEPRPRGHGQGNYDHLEVWDRAAADEDDDDEAPLDLFFLVRAKARVTDGAWILTQEYRHEPVMLGEVLESLRLKSGSVVCGLHPWRCRPFGKNGRAGGETGLCSASIRTTWPFEVAGARLDREVPAFRTSC